MQDPSPKRPPVDSALTTGGLWIRIWQISWPMFLIMILNFLVGLTDVYVAGHIGPEVQAALGFIAQLYFFVIIVGNAISIGTVAMVSRAIGAGDRHRAFEASRQSLLLGVYVSLALSAVGYLFHRELVALAGVPPEIRGFANHFLKVFSIALGANYILIVSNAVFQASGEVRKPLATMSLVTMMNVILVFVLVFRAGLGFRGIPLATVLSLTAGMLVNLAFFTTKRWRAVYAPPWTVSMETVRRIVALSWPAALLQIAWNSGSFVLYNILGRLGEHSITALASITNGLRIEAIIYLPAFALNMAGAVLTGQNLGARDPVRAERTGWRIAFMGVGLMSAMALVVFVEARTFSLFLAKTPGVLDETVRYLRFNMFSEPFMALSVVLGGCLNGAGDTRGAMLNIMIAMWLIRLPLAYVLAIVLGLGATGVWTAMVASMTIQGLLMARRFHRGRWKTLVVG